MKNRISIDNYEAFLLDHCEGKLDASLLQELKEFALLHPHLQIDLDDISLPAIDPSSDSFISGLQADLKTIPDHELIEFIEAEDKTQFELLQRKIDNDNVLRKELELYQKTILEPDNTVVIDKSVLLKTDEDEVHRAPAFLIFENSLSAINGTGDDRILSLEPELLAEFEAYKKTKLIADRAVVFEDKEVLYKKTKVIFFVNPVFRAAAAIALLFILIVVFRSLNTGTKEIEEKEIANRTNTVLPVLPSDKSNLEQISTNDNTRMVASSKVSGKPHRVIKDSSFKAKAQYRIASDPVLIALTDKTLSATSSATNATAKTFTDSNNSLPVASKETAADSALLAKEPAFAVVRYTNINALQVEQDAEEFPAVKEKNSLWKRAVKLAKQMNGLGITAVKGNSDENGKYSLTLNCFQVEKK